MAAPTREDAQLMLQILQWSGNEGMKDAMGRLLEDDFDPETADAHDDAVSVVLSVGEVIGTFVKHDLLSRELVEDIMWLDGIWAKVGAAALRGPEAAR